MALSSRGRDRDLWVRPSGWYSRHSVRRAPQVSVPVQVAPLADRLPQQCGDPVPRVHGQREGA